MRLALGREATALVAVALALLSSLPASASSPEASLVLEAGRWVFDVEVVMPMQSEPSHSTLQSCVTNEPVTVKHLMPWAEAQGCEISNVKSVQNGLKWRLLCDVNGQPSRGRGTFTAEGKSGEGKARVSVAMGARSLAIVTHWDARRVGPCSENSVSDQPRRLGTEEE